MVTGRCLQGLWKTRKPPSKRPPGKPEEALAEVTVDNLYTIIHVPHIDQVHMFYRATLTSEDFGAGEESLETQLFALEDIPWDELSFPTVRRTLELYVEDVRNEHFPVHVDDIRYRMGPRA